ncbi:MAG: class II glutamine amidotransferase [Nanoarchaeota archaeon]
MCRQAFFVPGFDREEAINILLNMEGKHNVDGTGLAYIKDKKFVIEKYSYSLSRVLRKNKNFLSHMPYNESGIIVHLRAASQGGNKITNTHPFQKGNWAVCHNGVWGESEIVRLALSNFVKFEGETDSEVAAFLIDQIGPKRFSEEIEFAGVFLALHISGELNVIKTSGQLEFNYLQNKRVLISSELEYEKYPDSKIALQGWYVFDKNGRFVKHKSPKMFYTPRVSSKNYKFVKINGKDRDKEQEYFNNRSLPSHYQQFHQFID